MKLCAGAGNLIHIITLADLYDPVQTATSARSDSHNPQPDTVKIAGNES
jgi:hypothetical protein